MTQTQLETNALFTQYLNVVNRAIGQHRDHVPYKQLMQVTDKLMKDKNVGVAVYKESADTPHDWFTLTMEDGKLRILEHGRRDPDTTWKIKEDHLRKVVEDPEEYVKHPFKLDLDWLTSRLGLS